MEKLKICGEGSVAPKYGYKNKCTDMPIPDGLKEELAQFQIIQSLDYYDFSTAAAAVHSNLFLWLNENIPFNAQYRSGPGGRNREVIHEKARHFIAVSESVRECLIAEGIAENRITVIPFWCAVQPDVICYSKESVTEGLRFRERQRIRPDSFVVLYVGRKAPEKGLNILNEAVSGMKNTALVFVGADGAYGTGVKGKFWDLQFQTPEQLVTIYHMADVLVLPSLDTQYWREQFGRVLTEAMSCMLPSIATDIGGPRDIVDHGKTGFLVPPNNPNSLRGALKRLQNEPELRKEMGKASLERWNRLFKKEVVDRQIMECYKKAGKFEGLSVVDLAK